MKTLNQIAIWVLVFQLSGLGPLIAQPVFDPIDPFSNRGTTMGMGAENLRVSRQSADGTEALLTLDYTYDGFAGPVALVMPVIGKRGQRGVSGWFGTDPVTVGRGRGTISVKVRYFNDEQGVPPMFTSDQVQIWILNRSASARLIAIPFLTTIKWGSATAKPTIIPTTPVISAVNTEQARKLAAEKRQAEEKARAEAEAREKARVQAVAEVKAREESEKRAKAEALAREEARQKAEVEATRIAAEAKKAEEVRLAEQRRLEEERLRAEAEQVRLAEEKRIAEEKARAEALAREDARKKAEAEAARIAAEAKKAEEVRLAEQRRREEERLRAEADQKRLAQEKQIAEEKARAEALARDEARQKVEAEAKRLAEEKRLADARALKEAEQKEKIRLAAEAKTREEARLKAEAEAKRLAQEKKIAEEKAKAEALAREEARKKAEEEARRLAEERRIAEEKAKAEALAREEARKKAEEEARRLAEERRIAEEKAKAEALAREEARKKAEEEARRLAEERRIAEEKAKAEALAREEAKRKAEAEEKRLAEEKRIAEEKALAEAKARQEAEEKARQEALAQAKAEEDAKRLAEEKKQAEALAAAASTTTTSPAPSFDLAPGMKTKITNVDVVKRSIDRTEMIIGVEYEYKDQISTPAVGVDVFRQAQPEVSRYFASGASEIAKSRRNFALLPVKFQPPAGLSDSAAFSTDKVMVYLQEANSGRRFNIFPATMLLVWRAAGAQAAANQNNGNSVEIDDFKQNDASNGYVSVKYNLLNGRGRLRAKIYDSKRPESAVHFVSEVRDVQAGRGLQLVEVKVNENSTTPTQVISADTVEVELLDLQGKVLTRISKQAPMVWSKPK